MIIKSLELADFRNYENLEITFDKGTNILYGDNAQGKTNILEAIYVSATTKSHKGSKDKEIVNFNKEEAHIRTYLLKEDEEINTLVSEIKKLQQQSVRLEEQGNEEYKEIENTLRMANNIKSSYNLMVSSLSSSLEAQMISDNNDW